MPLLYLLDCIQIESCINLFIVNLYRRQVSYHFYCHLVLNMNPFQFIYIYSVHIYTPTGFNHDSLVLLYCVSCESIHVGSISNQNAKTLISISILLMLPYFWLSTSRRFVPFIACRTIIINYCVIKWITQDIHFVKTWIFWALAQYRCSLL